MHPIKIRKELDELGIKYKRVYPNGMIKLEDDTRIPFRKLIKQLKDVESKKKKKVRKPKKKNEIGDIINPLVMELE